MTGNVWEWTSSLYKPYRYDASDGREELIAGDDRRVVRGGSWGSFQDRVHAACRNRLHPANRDFYLGFRVVCSSPILY
jgi:formylglycine-generating enzyme required for sulfatase activity